MNAQAMKEEANERSGTKRVETVEYRSSAGQGQEQRKVEVIHEPHFSEASKKSNNSGGVLAAAVTTLQSAQDALSQK